MDTTDKVGELEALLARLDERTDGDYLARLENGALIASECADFIREHGPELLRVYRDQIPGLVRFSVLFGDGKEIDLMRALESVVEQFAAPLVGNGGLHGASTSRAVDWLHAKYGTRVRLLPDGQGA